MKEDSFRKIVKTDIQRYTGSTKFNLWSLIKTVYYEEGLFFVILFRLSQKVLQIESLLLQILFKVIFLWTIYRFLSVFFGIQIDSRAKIGKGFYIGHYGGIFIGPAVMGKYCNISQQVTIGYGGLGTQKYGTPTFGDYVYIGPGAKIFGKIKIGNHVSIGANAVVSKDIPDKAVVVGNPGRIVAYKEKNENIHHVFE